MSNSIVDDSLMSDDDTSLSDCTNSTKTDSTETDYIAAEMVFIPTQRKITNIAHLQSICMINLQITYPFQVNNQSSASYSSGAPST